MLKFSSEKIVSIYIGSSTVIGGCYFGYNTIIKVEEPNFRDVCTNTFLGCMFGCASGFFSPTLLIAGPIYGSYLIYNKIYDIDNYSCSELMQKYNNCTAKNKKQNIECFRLLKKYSKKCSN